MKTYYLATIEYHLLSGDEAKDTRTLLVLASNEIEAKKAVEEQITLKSSFADIYIHSSIVGN